MRISIPKERKSGETRVAATPELVGRLVAAGATVRIEKNAGHHSGFEDAAYQQAGAATADTLEELLADCDLLLKVKEPSSKELALLPSGSAVFSFIHPAADPQMTAELVKRNITALDFDLVVDADGALPILKPMSEIAGRLSVYAAAEQLRADGGGPGLLFSGTDSTPGASVTVIGAGVSGSAAARLAAANGAKVTLLDINQKRLDQLNKEPGFSDVDLRLSDSEVLLSSVRKADVVIAAVLVPGERSPVLLDDTTMRSMKNGALLIDICIDQGGVASSSKATSIAEPTFVEFGVTHYCVPNMPGLVPATSTRALVAALEPNVLQLAEKGVDSAIESSEALRTSVVTRGGELVHPAVKRSIGEEVAKLL